MMRFVISDWVSNCGWNAELVRSVVPQRRNNSFHIVLVKTGSRSLTINAGSPWRWTICSKKAVATDVAM
jgi:hypothetical protein